jgi:hypothetical protein
MTREDARAIASIALERALRTTRGGSQAEEDCIADAILAAVAEERERCEMVARRYNPESWGHANLAVSYNTAQNIADIISGKVPDLQPKPEKVP